MKNYNFVYVVRKQCNNEILFIYLHVSLKMVRWALGVTRKDKIRNEYVRGTAKIAKLEDKLQFKATLVWPREKERRRLRGKKDDGDGDAR